MRTGIKKITTAILLVSAITLSGCSAVQTSFEHKDLQVSSKLSETIFLDPVSKSQQKVHVTIKNTSGESLSLAKHIKASIESHGYQVVSNPNNAHYLLQANVLRLGKMSPSDSNHALGHGYGSIVSGAGTAVAVSALGGSSSEMLGAGLVVGLADMAASSFIKDVNYSMITDVQLSERVGHEVLESTQAHFKNGAHSKTTQQSDKTSHFQRYRTRVVSNAEKVNLTLKEAKPELERSLVSVLSGLF